MAALQEPVQQLAGELVRGGRETGLQVAVYSGGQQVVDVVAGVADSATGRPVSGGHAVYAFSVGKAMTATIVHTLAERGSFGEEGYGVRPARQAVDDDPSRAYPYRWPGDRAPVSPLQTGGPESSSRHPATRTGRGRTMESEQR
jgi:hypothetical protein